MRGAGACLGFSLGAMAAVAVGARPAGAAPIATGTDQEIVMELHHDRENDVALGRLAERQCATSAVCELGARLVREHAAADARLLAYARTHGVDPDRIAHPYDAANHGSLKHPDLPRLVGNE